MRSVLKNNKAEVTDMMYFLLVVFVFAVGLFIMIFVTSKISTGIRSANLNTTSAGEQAVQALENISNSTINNGFLMLFAGFVISMMITSFLVRTHPIFLFLYIIFLAVTIILSFYLGNAYYTLQTNPLFTDILSQASYVNLIMNHIAEITIGATALSIIIVFAKFSTFGGTQQY